MDIQNTIRKKEDMISLNLRKLKSTIGYPVVEGNKPKGSNEEEAVEIGNRYLNFLDMINMQLGIAIETAEIKYQKYKGERKVSVKKITTGGEIKGRVLEL